MPTAPIPTTPEVRDNPAEHRFEIWLETDRAGFTIYELDGPSLAFVHTEIDEAFGGHGLGSILIKQALDAARGRGATVLPYCPFVKAYIAKHPSYLDLVPPTQRAAFGLPQP